MASNVRFRCFNHDMDCNCCILYRILLGSLLGIIRTLPNKPLALIGDTYVEIFRNIPLIVQLFFWAFVFLNFYQPHLALGAEKLLPVDGGKPAEWSSCGYWCFALGLYTAARVSEHIRAGINTVSRGQNLQHLQWVLPQAKVIAMWFYPLLIVRYGRRLRLKQWTCLKLSRSICAKCTQFFAYTKTMREETSQDIIILILSTPVYLIITYTIKFIMAWIEKRMAVPGLGSGGK